MQQLKILLNFHFLQLLLLILKINYHQVKTNVYLIIFFYQLCNKKYFSLKINNAFHYNLNGISASYKNR